MCRALLSQGATVYAEDAKDKAALDPELEELERVGMFVSAPDLREDWLKECDMVVASPGVPWESSVLQQARELEKPIIGEIEVAYRLNPEPLYIGVTGTNGKTTTCMLLGEIFRQDGRKVRVVGNIGDPLVTHAVQATKEEILVVELSSFQLQSIDTFRPKIAVILNIAEDHLDWHGKFLDYAKAKARIFGNQLSGDFTILNADDEEVRKVSKECRGKMVFFSTKRAISSDGVYVEERLHPSRMGSKKSVVAVLRRKLTEICAVDEIRLKGEHNVQNVLAACAVSLLCFVNPAVLRDVLKNFQAPPHRQEDVMEIYGIRFVNDSKGTNPHATMAALSAFDIPILLLAGGQGKSLRFGELAKNMKGKVKKLFAFGEAKDELYGEAVAAGVPCEKRNDLSEALESAYREARSGDVILLSPACASFDQFRGYEHRGEVFREIVLKLSRQKT